MKLGFPSTPICRDPGISSGYPVSHSIHPRLSIIQHLGDDDVDDEQHPVPLSFDKNADES